ncbi:STAS domain-containing protein [Azospirillum sp.]|uniref:STAS domain-containing protein n=1 Tax=Azospirillum sp. TaxID=34012 RepID=UPI003D723FCA
MEISESKSGDAAVLSIAGRLDSSTAQQLESRLTMVLDGHPAVVLDLAGLDYVSSAGLRVLLKGAKQAKGRNAALLLAGLRPHVQEVFDISGFTAIFAIHPDRKAAAAALGGA